MVLIVLIGIFPKPFLDRIRPAVAPIVDRVHAVGDPTRGCRFGHCSSNAVTGPAPATIGH